MSEAVSGLIQACEWLPSQYLVISDNVFAPLIYYSHFGALIPTVLIALFVFLNRPKEFTNVLLFLTAACFSVWIFSDLVLWATEYPSLVMFFWTLEIIFEPLVYLFAFYFVYVFIKKQDLSVAIKSLALLLLAPTLLLAGTSLGLLGFDLYNCDRAASEGALATYGYVVEGLFILSIAFLGITSVGIKNAAHRTQSILLALGTVLFLLSFSLGNIVEVFTENWYIGQIGLFGAPIFTAFLAYLIVRYQAFSSRLFAAQVLVSALWLSVLSLLFIRTIDNIRAVTALTLIFVLIAGFILIRGVRREIEQRKHIEKLAKDLEVANERLKELDQMKSEFLSIASHQLRAPITAVRGYAANINQGEYGPIPAHLKEPLETVQESARLMANSIEDYLNISRIEQNRMKYEKSTFDLADLAKKVVNELAPVAEKRKLSLTVNAPEDLNIFADIGKVKQVITNLVDNAIKYTEKGSVVVSVETVDKKARVTITDTGVGIAKEDIDGLFEKFKRARGANKINTTGTGLGLYVAKQLTEGNGGTIRIESDGPGKGSRFIVEFPI